MQTFHHQGEVRSSDDDPVCFRVPPRTIKASYIVVELRCSSDQLYSVGNQFSLPIAGLYPRKIFEVMITYNSIGSQAIRTTGDELVHRPPLKTNSSWISVAQVLKDS